MDGGGDEDFMPEQKAAKKTKTKNSLPENIRAELCTLKENHDEFFSTSFDASFHIGGGIIPSSSQMGGFGFGDDDLFAGADAFDVRGALGAELARELGDGWGSPVKERTECVFRTFERDIIY
jgi:meiotic recombination protein REC8